MPIVRVDDAGKEITKRKNAAKRFLILSLAGFLISALIYLIVSPEAGIFSAVVSSTLPSAVNLVDD